VRNRRREKPEQMPAASECVLEFLVKHPRLVELTPSIAELGGQGGCKNPNCGQRVFVEGNPTLNAQELLKTATATLQKV